MQNPHHGISSSFDDLSSVFLTAKVSGWLKASPLERRVRPEGQKGAPSLEDVRGP
jgi:hypothetical protein